jgi:quercetin dioxygenase-like cupin family protein
MAFTKVTFAAPFVPGAHPLERKKTSPHPSVVLLEFAPGFLDPNWCRRAHVVYVLRGELTLELEGARERIRTGECCVLDGGTAHRAANEGGEPVLAFVASDLQPAAAPGAG